MIVIMLVVMVVMMRMIVMGRQQGGDGLHALHAQRHRFADLAQAFGCGCALGRHFQHKADMAVLDHKSLDHVLLHHGAATGRIDHLVERGKHIIAKVCHGRSI